MSTKFYPSSSARSHIYFRLFIGWIGIAFPFALLVGHLVSEGKFLESISDYDYSCAMGNFFVGGLVALGILLISYRYAPADNRVSTIAGLCAMGVAFFPKYPDSSVTYCQGGTSVIPGPGQPFVGTLHYIFSATFLVLLAIIVIFFFTKPAAPLAQSRATLARLFGSTPLAARLRPSDAQLPPGLEKRKRQRNQIYEICGGVIIACLIVLGLLALHWISLPQGIHPVYWLETLPIVAFGVAWIIKGELILINEKTGPDPVQRFFAKVRR
jgi:hypothetical protein